MNHSQPVSPVQAHPASTDVYLRHGWHIIPMPRGSKGPNHPGWNHRENCITDARQLPPDCNVGLAHAYSGTMCLDIDNWDLAEAELTKHGIGLSTLYQAPDAVTIESGRQGHGKLVYAMPFGLVLPSKKLIAEVNGMKTNYLDFRCSTQSGLTVQDVLPPSIHPETRQAYQWGGKGHWSRLPTIPQPLLDFWTELLTEDTRRNIPLPTELDTSWTEIREALKFLSPDLNRDDWVKVGMALHFAATATDQLDQGFELWNEWSSGSAQKYKGTQDLWVSWRGFRPDGGISLGTLFKLAKDAGWQRPQPTIEEIFGPAPEEQTEDRLVDATAGTRAPIPTIDLDQFPTILSTRAREVAQSVGCDPLVPLFTGLAIASGVADARIRLELMPGYQVPPVLWIMTLGKPADKKTPGSIPMGTVLQEMEREDIARFRQEKLRWDAEKAVYDAAYKAYIEHYSGAESQLGNETIPEVPILRDEPVPLQLTVDDITSQKLAYDCDQRPRGVLCWMDEMAGWAKRVTDPRSTDDRSTWTKAYESKPAKIARVAAGNIHVENFAVSIYGNMQPGVFRKHSSKLGQDGLIQRFIPGILDSRKSGLNHPIPDAFSSKPIWDQTIRMIYALPAMTYRLSPDAFKVYREFQEWYYETKHYEDLLDSGDETQDEYMTAFGKMEGQCGRLALVMHLIEAPLSPEVSGDTMQRAVNICKGYIIPALRYMLGEISGQLEDSMESWVTQYILAIAGSRQTVTLREIKRAARRKIAKLDGMTDIAKNNLIVDAMAFLQQCQWVMLTDSTPTKGHWEWAVNPALAVQFKSQREEILKAKQKRLDYVMGQIEGRTGKAYPRKTVQGYDEELDD